MKYVRVLSLLVVSSVLLTGCFPTQPESPSVPEQTNTAPTNTEQQRLPMVNTALPMPDAPVASPPSAPSEPVSPPPSNQAPQAPPPTQEDSPSQEPEQEVTQTTYVGARLAGSTSPFLDFNKADYDKARAENKKIMLYFFATWCPLCKAELVDTHAAFNELDDPDVVGFRVNFNDGDTDSDEVGLAREFGVAYQHTKVFIVNGERVEKSPATWRKAQYQDAFERLF